MSFKLRSARGECSSVGTGRRGAALLLSLLAGGALGAQSYESGLPQRELPSYNILAARPKKDLKATSLATANLQKAALLRADQGVVLDELLGVPTFLWASAQAANKRPAQISPQFALAGSRMEAAIAREHLNRFASLYALTSQDVATAALASVHNTGKGAVIVKLRQNLQGVEVFRDEVNIVMNQNLDLVAISGHISPAASSSATASASSFSLPVAEALSTALNDLTGTRVGSDTFEATATQSPYTTYRIKPVAAQALSIRFRTPARIKPVFFNLPEGLQAAYYIELDTQDLAAQSSQAYAYVLSATDGSLLFRKNLTAEEAFTYRVWADAQKVPLPGPTASFLPHPTGLPDGSFPAFIAPSLVTLEKGPIGTNDPWLPPGATVTNGNNVDAYVDLDATDGLSGADFRASVSAANTFDYPYDPQAEPGASTAQRMAAITQLFYTTNFLHDWFYGAGFDEASGNAQTSNYGRGGVEGDNLHVEAQDAGGLDNANMMTPADGGHPRMQMYLWDAPKTRTLTLSSGGATPSGSSAFGAQTYSLSGEIVLVDDGAAPTTNACEAVVNNLAGKVALIDRGSCTYGSKVMRAQAAGAIAVIIANNVASAGPVNMGTDLTLDPSSTTIPALSISKENGDLLKTALSGGVVTATLNQVVDASRDGSIDAQIVAHEWGHYISNRLIGNGSGINTYQSAAMGEGWGDFHALLMSVQDGATNLDGAFALCGYSTFGTTPASNSYYFGIRRYPYSTDLTKNALTFKHIASGEALPAGVPVNPNSSVNYEVHNAGEIWATMLWEAYAALLKDTQLASPRLTFSEAQDRMKRYLVAAYKATPLDPTFLEARDTLLTVAAANDPVDAQAFLKAFAKRGAGVGAVAPGRYSVNFTGLTESFTLGGVLAYQGAAVTDVYGNPDQDGKLYPGKTGLLQVTLKNLGGMDLSHTTATISNPDVSFPGGSLLAFPTSTAYASVTGSLRFVLNSTASVTSTTFNIAYSDTDAGSGSTTASFRVNLQDVPQTSSTDDFSASDSAWTPTGTPPWQYLADTPTTHHWQGPDYGAPSDTALVSPLLKVSGTAPLILTLTHAYSFEFSDGTSWDGGVIEVSKDNGSTWADIAPFCSGFAYPGSLATSNSNPLTGRPAFVGASAGYPTPTDLVLNLGTSLAGEQQVKFRFRIGNDAYTGDQGWTLRKVAFSGLTNAPFPTTAARVMDLDVDADASLTVLDLGEIAGSFGALSGAPAWRAKADLNGDGQVDDADLLLFLNGLQ